MNHTSAFPSSAPLRHSPDIYGQNAGYGHPLPPTASYRYPRRVEAADGNRRQVLTSSPRIRWPTYLLACTFIFLATANVTSLLPAIPDLVSALKIDIDRAGSFTVYTVLFFALGNIVWIPLARIVGTSLVHLSALLLLIATNIWAARASSHASFLAARMLSGFAAAAADCTVPGLELELWPEQSRAWHLMMYQFAWISGLFFGPLISGYILQPNGLFRWIPGWLAIGFGVVFLGFLLVETMSRKMISSREPSLKQLLGMPIANKFPAKTLVASLRNSLVMTVYPPVLWSAILLGVLFGSTIVIQLAALATFFGNWKIDRIGLFDLAGWIGAVLSLPFGLAIDKVLRKYSQPHRRQLILVALPAVVAPVGLIVCGARLSIRRSWIGPAFGYAMHSFGLTVLGTSLLMLLVDTYEEHTPEATATFCTIRGLIAVLCCAFYRSWSAKDGIMAVFGTLAGLEWALFALTVPLYLFWPKVSRWKGLLTLRSHRGREPYGVVTTRENETA